MQSLKAQELKLAILCSSMSNFQEGAICRGLWEAVAVSENWHVSHWCQQLPPPFLRFWAGDYYNGIARKARQIFFRHQSAAGGPYASPHWGTKETMHNAMTAKKSFSVSRRNSPYFSSTIFLEKFHLTCTYVCSTSDIQIETWCPTSSTEGIPIPTKVDKSVE